eukprot:4671997-Amphidinium_carterae.1
MHGLTNLTQQWQFVEVLVLVSCKPIFRCSYDSFSLAGWVALMSRRVPQLCDGHAMSLAVPAFGLDVNNTIQPHWHPQFCFVCWQRIEKWSWLAFPK